MGGNTGGALEKGEGEGLPACAFVQTNRLLSYVVLRGTEDFESRDGLAGAIAFMGRLWGDPPILDLSTGFRVASNDSRIEEEFLLISTRNREGESIEYSVSPRELVDLRSGIRGADLEKDSATWESIIASVGKLDR